MEGAEGKVGHARAHTHQEPGGRPGLRPGARWKARCAMVGHARSPEAPRATGMEPPGAARRKARPQAQGLSSRPGGLRGAMPGAQKPQSHWDGAPGGSPSCGTQGRQGPGAACPGVGTGERERRKKHLNLVNV